MPWQDEESTKGDRNAWSQRGEKGFCALLKSQSSLLNYFAFSSVLAQLYVAREAESQFQVCWNYAGILCSTKIILNLCFHREHTENGSEVETTDRLSAKEKKDCKWEINDRNWSVQPNFLVMFHPDLVKNIARRLGLRQSSVWIAWSPNESW